jgi:hypothetical protein
MAVGATMTSTPGTAEAGDGPVPARPPGTHGNREARVGGGCRCRRGVVHGAQVDRGPGAGAAVDEEAAERHRTEQCLAPAGPRQRR